MSKKPVNTHNLSGEDFVALIQVELERLNSGLAKTSLAEISQAAGHSKAYLKSVVEAEQPNPTILGMRCVLYVLGFDISNPHKDVIPRLKSKNVYKPKVGAQS